MKGFKSKLLKASKQTLPLLAIGCIGTFMMSQKAPSSTRVIEADKIILRSANGDPAIILDASQGVPQIILMGKNGASQIEIFGGDCPVVTMKDGKNNKEMIQISITQESNPLIMLKDMQGVARVQMQGGQVPAYFLKNEQSEIIGTMITLQDGGSAIGLADKEGDVAAFIRGGYTPSISFFQKSAEPQVALGISRQVPHLLVSSPSTKDNLVLHGGDPTSLIFVDEQGEVPVLLSKHGLFQGKKQQTQTESKKEDKIFTWDELKNPLKDVQLPRR